MPELPGSGCVADVPAAAAVSAAAAAAAGGVPAASVVGEVPEIAASAVLVASEELPVGSDVVKVRNFKSNGTDPNFLVLLRFRSHVCGRGPHFLVVLMGSSPSCLQDTEGRTKE
jgi:hypothetical protein